MTVAAAPVSVREAGPAAAAVFARLHAEAFDEPWPEAAFATLLADPGTAGRVAERAGAPAGLALVRVAAEEAELLTLGVAPAARRSGVGRALLDAACEAARARGASAMYLEVSDRNMSARALYARGGFTEAGRRAGYYRDGSDALILRAILVSGEE